MMPPWRAPAGLNVAFGLNRFDKGANPIKVQETGVHPGILAPAVLLSKRRAWTEPR